LASQTSGQQKTQSHRSDFNDHRHLDVGPHCRDKIESQSEVPVVWKIHRSILRSSPAFRVGPATLAVGFGGSTGNLKFLSTFSVTSRNFRFGNSAFRGGARTLAGRFDRSTGFLKFLSAFPVAAQRAFALCSTTFLGGARKLAGRPNLTRRISKKVTFTSENHGEEGG